MVFVSFMKFDFGRKVIRCTIFGFKPLGKVKNNIFCDIKLPL